MAVWQEHQTLEQLREETLAYFRAAAEAEAEERYAAEQQRVREAQEKQDELNTATEAAQTAYDAAKTTISEYETAADHGLRTGGDGGDKRREQGRNACIRRGERRGRRRPGGTAGKKTARELTYLRVVSYGLIAGLERKEIDRMRPGEILDLYYYRSQYDRSMRMW